MSIQSLAFASATTGSFGAAIPLNDNSRRLPLLASIYNALTTMPAKTDSYSHQDGLEGLESDGNSTFDGQIQENEAINASLATTKAGPVHNKWQELRTRVETVDPRVFAYQNDPKYLQQCEQAKQRRALAAGTPVWH
ncbi:hypothetical protein CCR75_003499 [Bremia lactucae]|uniref:Uncharacterized protein n=1 Tax=Bremia lactucae TaxID=4779 RepID=A0A976IH19_BRELC|nr:hypothetical protein CCR75_003499 [Bremia lactucae]